jgi:catechol 2,3-dioxygenase-like lactoylglutathione lyase family enzyme
MASPVPFAILGLDHIVLRARDMAVLERFYCEVIGCALERRQAAFGLVQLRAGRTLIDLVDVAGPIGREGGRPPASEGHNLEHFCLRIEPFDAAAITAYLKSHGVEPSAVESRFGADGQGPSIYIFDPESNRVELKGPPGA